MIQFTARGPRVAGRRQIFFSGVLYAGLILTAEGPKVIEFNARLGDPETQVVLPRLKSDLIEVILKLMAGEKPELDWDPRPMLGVVVACDGYPQDCAGRPRLGGQCLWPLPIFIFITVEWRRAVGAN